MSANFGVINNVPTGLLVSYIATKGPLLPTPLQPTITLLTSISPGIYIIFILYIYI